MGTITALRYNSREKQVNVFVDSLFSFTVSDELVATNHLRVGRQLSQAEIAELKDANLFHSCMDAAIHFLSYRPRTEKEVRQRLRRRGFMSQVVDGVVTKLKERKLIDDSAFSQFWLNNRLSFSPRSARMIKLELRRKGVSADTADEVIEDLDDEDSSYKAGLKKARQISGLDQEDFRRRLYDYLRRRGFNYETVKRAVERLWQDVKSDSL